MNQTEKRLLEAGWQQQIPEVGRFWIGYSPRLWPGPEDLWQDLSSGRLGKRDSGFPEQLDKVINVLDDLVYLPPVREDFRSRRDDLARALVDREIPVLLQLDPREPIPKVEAMIVFDPLANIVAGRLDLLSDLPPRSTVAWPLIPGISTSEGLWQDALSRLAETGIGCVQATAYTLEPDEKRRIASQGDDSTFEAVFHSPEVSECAFSRQAYTFGAKPFVERPVARSSSSWADNRLIAAHLSLVAELCYRTERSESLGQAFFAAARWIDQTRYDIAGLCREGNLGVASPLDTGTRDLVAQFVTGGRSDLGDELMSEYTKGDRG